MNKEILIKTVASKIEGSTNKLAGQYVDAVIDSIIEGIEADGVVDITKFIKFEVKERAARTARNVTTGAPIEVPAKNVVKIKPLKRLKEVNI